jgi:hypothetical protein
VVDGPDADTTPIIDIGAYETQQTVLADLADQVTKEDTQLLVPFDANGISSVTATSSDANLVPNDAAHLNAVIENSTVVVTINPATNANGSCNITITVNVALRAR